MVSDAVSKRSNTRHVIIPTLCHDIHTDPPSAPGPAASAAACVIVPTRNQSRRAHKPRALPLPRSKLMEYEPSKRPSADAALKYRFVTGKAPLVDLEQLVEPLIDEKFLDGIARTGEYSVLTEAKLDELEMKREKMPEDYVRISQTLTWWADRQKSMQRRLEERKRLQERRLAGACLEHGR